MLAGKNGWHQILPQHMYLKWFHLKYFKYLPCVSQSHLLFPVWWLLKVFTPYPFTTLAYAGICKHFSKLTEKNFMYFKILLSTNQPLLPHFITQRSIRRWHPNPNHLRSKSNTGYQIGHSSRWQSMVEKQGQKIGFLYCCELVMHTCWV